MTKSQLETSVQEINARIGKITSPSGLATPKVDGIIRIDDYLTADTKVLWILKEINSPNDGGDWVLSHEIGTWKDNGRVKSGWGKTFNAIIKSSYGILTNKGAGEIKKQTRVNREMLNEFNKVAFINLKKIPGGSTAINKKVNEAYIRDKDIVLDQIKAFEPDIIICGCAYPALSELERDLKANSESDYQYLPNKEKANYSAFYNDKHLVVKARHPQGANHEEFYSKIIGAINEWKSLRS